MSDWLIVLVKIAAMILVILTGFAARRRGYLTAESTSVINRFAVDIALPSLVLTQMLRTLSPEVLRQSWFIPLYAGSIYVIAMLTGLAAAPMFVRRATPYTFIFLVGTPNWLYLPLPIVEALYREDGVRAMFLANAGIQILLWSLGIWVVTGGRLNKRALRTLLTNPGLIATAAGALLAAFVPLARKLATGDLVDGSPLTLAANILLQGMAMIGSLTIPLSLLMTGAVLGGLQAGDRSPLPAVFGVIFSRLMLTPVVVVALVWLLGGLGLEIPFVPRMVGFLIAAMPVAVTCTIVTDRFAADTPLAARSILYSTLLSIVTVPSCFFLIQIMGL